MTRVPGPHFAPTTFGGIALLGFLALMLLQRGRYDLTTWVCLASTAMVALTTVTRHVLLALAIGMVVGGLFGGWKDRLRLVLILVGVGLAAIPLAAYFSHAWEVRLAKWDEGIMSDENTSRRLVDGPIRLFTFFKSFPEAIPLGAGLDPDKLASRTDLDFDFQSGFVSNSFLLPLYYMGFSGFLLYAAFWWTVARYSLKSPRQVRGAFVSTAAVCVAIIASDNYAVVYEVAATMLNLIAGLILAEAAASQPKRRSALQPAPTIDAPAAPLPAR